MKINKELIKKYPWKTHFRNRNAIVAKAISENSRVLDLGGGFGGIFRFLKNCDYLSLDIECWTDCTIKADFNRGQFPDMHPKFDYLVCQGILEYINKPEEFLENIKKYGSIMLLTYRPGQTDIEKQVNDIDFESLRVLLKNCGWEIIFEKPIANAQILFYCRKHE